MSYLIFLNEGTRALHDQNALSKVLFNNVLENVWMCTILYEDPTLLVETYLTVPRNHTMIDGADDSDASLLILPDSIDLNFSSTV